MYMEQMRFHVKLLIGVIRCVYIIAAVVSDELTVEEEEDYLMLSGPATSAPCSSPLTRIGYGVLPADGDVGGLCQRSRLQKR